TARRGGGGAAAPGPRRWRARRGGHTRREEGGIPLPAWDPQSRATQPGPPTTVPYTPTPAPAPPERPEGDGARPPSPPAMAQAAANIKEMGTDRVPQSPPDIHVLTIVGQVEGHLQLPAQNKTTKYEHIIPQLVAVEQNPAIKGL